MKTSFGALSIIVTVMVSAMFLLDGCASVTGNLVESAMANKSQIRFPHASVGFVPQKMYTIDYDTLWTKTLKILIANRIATIQADKGSGLITTDWIEGETQGKGIYGAIMTRYKYSLLMQRTNDGKVQLDITSKLESRSLDGKVDWHDVSASNQPLLTSLEYWLYEQIEKSP